MELGCYQDGTITGSHVKIDSSNADSDHQVDNKPQPVITKVSWHVNKGTFR